MKQSSDDKDPVLQKLQKWSDAVASLLANNNIAFMGSNMQPSNKSLVTAL